jgi:glycine hydroxymethyltransferase
MVVDLRPIDLTGSKVEKVVELANIALNKNTVPGDKSALNPSGIRIGAGVRAALAPKRSSRARCRFQPRAAQGRPR